MNEYFKCVLKNLKGMIIGLLNALFIIGLIILIFAIPFLFLTGIMNKEPILCILSVLVSVLAGIIFILVKSFFDMKGKKR